MHSEQKYWMQSRCTIFQTQLDGWHHTGQDKGGWSCHNLSASLVYSMFLLFTIPAANLVSIKWLGVRASGTSTRKGPRLARHAGTATFPACRSLGICQGFEITSNNCLPTCMHVQTPNALCAAH